MKIIAKARKVDSATLIIDCKECCDETSHPSSRLFEFISKMEKEAVKVIFLNFRDVTTYEHWVLAELMIASYRLKLESREIAVFAAQGQLADLLITLRQYIQSYRTEEQALASLNNKK